MSREVTPLDAMEMSLQHHLSTIPAPAPREHPAEHAAHAAPATPADPAARITLDEVCDDAESTESP